MDEILQAEIEKVLSKKFKSKNIIPIVKQIISGDLDDEEKNRLLDLIEDLE